ncbi:uncharacterized protein [Parasteatoda tepidariorum]|uniref:uncharacterized protein n=1 Tax=Parasteatoda tepidariorum TaxID=114398 RepID=UPI001C720348|nr:uncharacterized protein LOC107438217 [Parasteatoda tepidariorum]
MALIIQRHFKKRDTTGWTRWTDWDCPVTCGGGTARRIRQCIDRKSGCEGPSLETQPCAETPCPEGTPPELLKMANRQIELDSRSYQVQKGDKVTLDCQGSLRSHISSYYRNAKSLWHHNKNIYKPDEQRTGIMHDTKNMVIAEASPEDNGVWYCEVQLNPNAPLFTAVYTLAVENDEADVEVAEGESFTLPCKAERLSKFFKAKMAIQWYHNTQLRKQFRDANPVDVSELVIDESSPEDNGVWVCKVIEQDIDLQRASKEWTTNAILVRVLDSKSAGAAQSTEYENTSQTVVLVIIVCIIVSLILVGGLYYFFRIRKKSSKDKSQDAERGGSGKKSRKKKRKDKVKEMRETRTKPKKKKTLNPKKKGGSNKSGRKRKEKSHRHRKNIESDEDY